MMNTLGVDYPLPFFSPQFIKMDKFLVGILAILILLIIYYNRATIAQKLAPESMIKVPGVPQPIIIPWNRRPPTAMPNHDAAGHKTIGENLEYFSACKDAIDPTKDLDCAGDDSRASYAVNEFGAPNMDFGDWVKAQGVDPEVRKNHKEFVDERLGGSGVQGAITTGRTYSPDSNDSYDPYPWVGIRGRPQAVPVCNPSQMPDTDFDLYPVKSKMTWNSVGVN